VAPNELVIGHLAQEVIVNLSCSVPSELELKDDLFPSAFIAWKLGFPPLLPLSDETVESFDLLVGSGIQRPLPALQR
jgi:hypothetical protein